MNNPKSMLEKLTNYNNKMQTMSRNHNKQNAGGYAVVFQIDDEEVIEGKYIFPEGIYTIISINKRFIHWKYTPRKSYKK